MRDMKLDQYHDIAIEDNDFATIEGAAETAQSMEIELLIVKGEYWLDGNRGVPWNDGMFQPWMTQAEKELHVKRAALRVAGVTSVDKLVYSHDVRNRSDLIEIEATTVEGKIGKIGV